MNDLDDLNRVFAALERRADAHALPAFESPAAPPRRRAVLVAAAVVTVGAVATGATPLATRSDSGQPAAGSGSPTPTVSRPATPPTGPEIGRPFRQGWTTLPGGHYLVDISGVPGAQFTSVIGAGTPETEDGFGRDYQETQITSDEGGFVFKINVVGGWAPTGGTPLSINDSAAYYGRFLLHPEIAGHPVPPRWALAWQYADGAWATVASTTSVPIPLDTAKRLVAQVRIVAADAIPSPPPQDR